MSHDTLVLVRTKPVSEQVYPRAVVVMQWMPGGQPPSQPGRFFRPSRFVIEKDWDELRSRRHQGRQGLAA